MQDVKKRKFGEFHSRNAQDNPKVIFGLIGDGESQMPQVFNIPKVEHDQPCSTLVVIVSED